MSVHNLRRERMGPDDVYIGRPSHTHDGHIIAGRGGYFGNPFRIGRDGDRETVIAKFEADARRRIEREPEYRERVKALHGKRLFCHCAPLACHGDVLEALAAELEEADRAENGAVPIEAAVAECAGPASHRDGNP